MADELDGLDPQNHGPVTLVSGTQVEIVPLRARQFFKFLRILTHGALPAVSNTSLGSLDPNGDASEFTSKLLSLLLLSIPDAEDETIIFVRSMVEPVGLIKPARNKQDNERNDTMWNAVDIELFNPDLNDLVSICEAIVRRESEDIQALGKRLSQLFKLAAKTGQLSQTRKSPTETSSVDSATPSTSSAPSTDGPTTTSEDSPSDAFANA